MSPVSFIVAAGRRSASRCCSRAHGPDSQACEAWTTGAAGATAFALLVFPGLAWADPAPTFEQEVLALANVERWTNGQLPPLKGVALLDQSAELHSENMAERGFFAHCDLDEGTLPWDRMSAAGYAWNAAGENIAAGYTTPEAVMTAWMNSSGHRANILSSNFRELGVGHVYEAGDQGTVRRDSNGDCASDATGGPYGHYWTQNFGTRNQTYPVVIEREAFQVDDPHVDLYLYGAGWAVDMRLRNDQAEWTDWMPFQSEVGWVLPAVDGLRRVDVEIRNGATVRTAFDEIHLIDQGTADLADVGTPVDGLWLGAPTPNPCSVADGATLRFQIPDPNRVALTVHDVSGRQVATVALVELPAGRHELHWSPGALGPGVYYLRLQQGAAVAGAKVLLLE